ncbi:glycosyltransferase family 4 protein [Oscillatoria salina]|uniref:glycosyltransferase family 4 protein n=1 Tax=Oscillatoria salina TaxID=331517 RepID=UPI001CCA3988|nr:glycosyltransferase family 4 protein [Oscillatoria salina]MBZ8180780.1 glycosyltransferase family 4 protein [Oscillatoria salina IIICB1]
MASSAIAKNNNQKLKISLVVSDLSSSGSGRWGGAVRPFLLAKALQKLNCDVEMLGLAFDSSSSTISAPEISIVSFPCQYYSGVINAASHLLKRIDGDLIYAVKLKTSSFGIAIIKKLLSRRPLLLDIDDWELSWHGGDEWQYRPSLKQLARDLLQPEGALRYPDHPFYLKRLENLVNYADAVTVHTKFLQQRFGGISVPNGKDTSLFSPEKYDPEASRAKYNLSPYKVLMFPGAPRPYKGVEDLLMALDILEIPDLRLVIVGGSPYDDYDRQLIAQWGRWIIKLPRCPVEQMPEVVSAAHVLVVPQRDTPAAQAQFPLKLTDGMAMAKPILSTCVGDIPEIIGDTGFLVEPSSPQQLAAAIKIIFDNWELATEKGKKARERCVEYYSVETMANVLASVIEPWQKIRQNC